MKDTTIVREAWRLYYRKLRIRRREAALAAEDMVIYGTGYLLVDDDGTSRRIPPRVVWVDSAKLL